MKLNLNNIDLVTAGLPTQFPRDTLPQIAFSGRSNVGKSSLVNCLIGRKSFARVSGEPGKTITVNFYRLDKKMYIVDLPGYGYAKRSANDQKRWSGLVEGYITETENLKMVVQLIDMKIGPTQDDNLMIDYLASEGVPFIVVATKSDKLNRSEYNSMLGALRSHPLIPENLPIIPFSAKTAENKQKIWDEISKVCN